MPKWESNEPQREREPERKDYSRSIIEPSGPSPDWRDDDALEKLARMVSDVGGLTHGGVISSTLALGVLRLLHEKRGER